MTVVGDTLNIAAGGGTTDIRPASGQTYLLKAVAGGNGNADHYLQLYDGTEAARLALFERAIGSWTNPPSVDIGAMSIPLTNSHYARLLAGTGSLDVGWRAVRLDV